MRTYGIGDVYKDFAEEDKTISRDTFVSICKEFNMLIMDSLLKGKEFNMGHNMSTLSVVRVPRNPKNPAINWGASNRYKKELLAKGVELYDKETGKGKKWHIYFTDAFYFKYYWRKAKCKVKCKTVYRFDATRGVKGNKGKLKQIDPLDHHLFRLMDNER